MTPKHNMLNAALVWCLVLMTVATARELNKDLICPRADTGFNVETDFPDTVPVYKVGEKHQIWLRNGWEGVEDYSADVQFNWDKRAINMALDIKDDAFFPSRSKDVQNLSGDYILLLIEPKTAAPNVIKKLYRVLLIPDPEKGACDVRVLAGDTPSTLIGKPSVAIKKADGGYRLAVTMPTTLWNTKPALDRNIEIQIIFGDSDESGKVQHSLALFPKWGKYGNFLHSRGALHFVEDSWVQAYPAQAKFDQGKLNLKLQSGNLTDKALNVGLAVLDPKGNVVKAFDKLKTLEPGNVVNREPISLSLPELSPGKEYTVNTQIGEWISPASFKLVADKELKGSVYSPGWIEQRLRLKLRNLPVTERAAQVKETYRQMAGGGTVIWHAGAYDGSSREFPERMRKNGRYTIEIKDPVADADTIPWALFGGMDTLDGMNEPIEIVLPATATEAFTPDYPISFDYLTMDKTRKPIENTSNRLLLIGMVCTHSGGDQYPIIQVKNQVSNVLLEEELRPGSSQFPSQPHAYVLRVWLSSKDESVRISNINERGPRAEIDFMALIGGGGEPLAMPKGEPSIAFEGGDVARLFNKMLVTNHYFARNYLMSPEGKTLPSPPGGRLYFFKLRDHMAMLEELSAWYNDKPIKRAIPTLSLAPTWQRKGFRDEDPVSDMLSVIAVWNHWRKSGLDRVILETQWQTVVESQLTKVKNAVSSNSMGLMSGTGEYGTASGDRGVSLPLSHIAMTALNCGVEMANAMGNRAVADEWSLLAKKVNNSISDHLTAAPGGEKVHSSQLYKAAHGLPQQKGVNAVIPPGALLYGKTANKDIVLYNEDIRVFDSPYIYAGLPYVATRSGVILDEADRKLLQKTTLFLRSGSVLKQKDFLEHNLVTYKSTASQLWMISALLLSENLNYAGKMIEGLVRYNFDEYSTIHAGDDIELSPFALEEKLNVGSKGRNKGGSLDDCNAMTVALFLKLSRLLAGIDDHNLDKLVIAPRLPADWRKVTVSDWETSHNIDNSVKTTTLNMTYRRAGGGYKMELESIGSIQNLEIRIGPFRSSERRIQVTMDGKTSLMPTKNINGIRWLTLELKRVREATIEALPGRF